MKPTLPIVAFLIGFVFQAGLGTAAGESVSRAYAQPSEVSVVEAWVSALNGGDTTGALALLAGDAVLIIDSGPQGGEMAVYTGKAEITRLLEEYQAANFRTQLVSTPRVVNGTTSWIERQSSDRLRQADSPYVDMRADALLEAGKIRSLIYEPDSASSGEAATGMPKTGRSQEEPPGPLFALLALGLAGLALGVLVRLSASARRVLR